MNQIWVKWSKVIIKLINGIIKWVNSGQIHVIQVDPKTTYLLNELCRSTQI